MSLVVDEQTDQVGGVAADVCVVARSEASRRHVASEESLLRLAPVGLAEARRDRREHQLLVAEDSDGEQAPGDRLEWLVLRTPRRIQQNLKCPDQDQFQSR